MEAYISTGAFPFNELPAIIEFSVNHGIDRIELSSGVAYDPNLLDQVRATNQMQLLYLVHNYFPPPEQPFVLNLASSDPKIQKLSFDLCREAIDLSSELGAPFYSVHSGFAFDMLPDLLGKPAAQRHIPKSSYIPYSEAYDVFKENIIGLAKHARSKGVRLLIENNVVSPTYMTEHNDKTLLMVSADEITQLITDVDDSALGVLVDVGHVNVTAHALGFRREAFVEALAPHIGAFHLSDNDGQTDQNLPFSEDTWFCPLLTDFPHVPVVIEAYNLTWRQIQEQFQVLDVLKA
jgi:sugar phosphate isomerase/epimerase